MSYNTGLRGGFIPREYMRYTTYNTPVGPEDEDGDILPIQWLDEDVDDYRRHKRLHAGRNNDPPAKRRIVFDDGDIELKEMQVDNERPKYKRVSRMSLSNPVGYGPRRRVVHGRSRKVKARQKLMYRANLSNPSTVLRTDAVLVSAAPNTQAVVVNMMGANNLQESEATRTPAQLLAMPMNEIMVDRDSDNGNFHNEGKVGVLRHYVDYGNLTPNTTSTITSNAAILGGATTTLRFQNCSVRPAMAWTLMDNWMWRDMLLYCSNKYGSNQLALTCGYHPPRSTAPFGSYVNGINCVMPASLANPDTVNLTMCAVSDFAPPNDIAYQGYVNNPGIGGRGKNLYVHNASIKFELENLENTGVYVDVYELTMRNSERFDYAGTEAATQALSTAYPVGRFTDPVELWHAKLRRWANSLGQPFTIGLNQEPGNTDAVETTGQQNRFNIYHVGQDPTKWITSEYYVNKKTIRLAEGGKGSISFTINYQNYIQPSWWDKFYGIKGLTRTYMMVVKGDRAIVSTAALGVAQQGSNDANVRVNVVKAWKAGFGVIREKNKYVERKLRVNSSSINGLYTVSADGTLGNADEVGGIGIATNDQQRTFGLSAGNLMVENAVPVV